METTEKKQTAHPDPHKIRCESRQSAAEKLPIPIKLRKGTREKIAKNAIKYRIPMEVTQIVQHIDGNTFPRCPHCKRTIEREYMNFCDRCGQKLGWKNFHNAVVRRL